MDKVLLRLDREVAADGARRRFLGIRRPHQVANDLPGVCGALNDEEQGWPSGDERHQAVVEGLSRVFRVMTGGRHLVNHTKLRRDDAQLLLLQASDDLANETPFDAVRLHDDKCSIHEEEI